MILELMKYTIFRPKHRPLAVLLVCVGLGACEAEASHSVFTESATIVDSTGQYLWEAPGPTGAWISGNLLGLVSRDRYWTANSDNNWSWDSKGVLSQDTWPELPNDCSGFWINGGVTAGYMRHDTGVLTVIGRNQYLRMNAQGNWIGCGLVSDIFPNATPVGGIYPWSGAGITAVFRDPRYRQLAIINGDKYWVFRDEEHRYVGQGYLRDIPTWQNAPIVQEQQPWDGEGLTAAWFDPTRKKLHLYSKDKYWIMDQSHADYRQWSWFAAGTLEDGWRSSPYLCVAASCVDHRFGELATKVAEALDRMESLYPLHTLPGADVDGNGTQDTIDSVDKMEDLEHDRRAEYRARLFCNRPSTTWMSIDDWGEWHACVAAGHSLFQLYYLDRYLRAVEDLPASAPISASAEEDLQRFQDHVYVWSIHYDALTTGTDSALLASIAPDAPSEPEFYRHRLRDTRWANQYIGDNGGPWVLGFAQEQGLIPETYTSSIEASEVLLRHRLRVITSALSTRLASEWRFASNSMTADGQRKLRENYWDSAAYWDNPDGHYILPNRDYECSEDADLAGRRSMGTDDTQFEASPHRFMWLMSGMATNAYLTGYHDAPYSDAYQFGVEAVGDVFSLDLANPPDYFETNKYGKLVRGLLIDYQAPSPTKHAYQGEHLGAILATCDWSVPSSGSFSDHPRNFYLSVKGTWFKEGLPYFDDRNGGFSASTLGQFKRGDLGACRSDTPYIELPSGHVVNAQGESAAELMLDGLPAFAVLADVHHSDDANEIIDMMRLGVDSMIRDPIDPHHDCTGTGNGSTGAFVSPLGQSLFRYAHLIFSRMFLLKRSMATLAGPWPSSQSIETDCQNPDQRSF